MKRDTEIEDESFRHQKGAYVEKKGVEVVEHKFYLFWKIT
jgi:hypothetical protein